jgi:membrane protein required for colicin V production
MNWLDAVYIIILLVTALLGVWKGLLKLVFAFVAVVLGIIFGGYAGNALGSAFGGGYVAIIVCSAILSIIIAFVIYLILTRFVQRAITWTPVVWLDRLGGLGLGLAVGFTICGVISALLGIIVTWSIPHIPPEALPGWLQGTEGALHSAQAYISNVLHNSALEPAVRGYFDWILAILPSKLDPVRHFLGG